MPRPLPMLMAPPPLPAPVDEPPAAAAETAAAAGGTGCGTASRAPKVGLAPPLPNRPCTGAVAEAGTGSGAGQGGGELRRQGRAAPAGLRFTQGPRPVPRAAAAFAG